MDKFNNKEVEEVFNSYPENINKKMMLLRQIVLETAKEILITYETQLNFK